jgi:hypothetical protein
MDMGNGESFGGSLVFLLPFFSSCTARPTGESERRSRNFLLRIFSSCSSSFFYVCFLLPCLLKSTNASYSGELIPISNPSGVHFLRLDDVILSNLNWRLYLELPIQPLCQALKKTEPALESKATFYGTKWT